MLSFQEAASPCSVARARVPKRVLLAAMLAWMAMPATAAPRAADPASQAARAVAPRDEAAPLPRYSLPQLLELARAGHPALAASRAQVQAAQAGMATARAWPNPEVEAMTGRQRARMPGAAEGRTSSMSITQKLDLPWQRTARMQAADAAFEGSQAQARSSARDLEAQLKLRFYDVLRREAEQRSAREDVTLVEQIRRRVAVRVETGEAPRYELIRGDAELLNAQRTDQAAALRVQQALAELRRAVGAELPAAFDVDAGSDAESAAVHNLPPLADLVGSVLATHPDLEADRAAVREAEARLAHERSQRWPSLALRGSVDRQPDLQDSRVGLVVSIPLFDRREGPVGEAVAALERARATLRDRELQMRQAVESAYRQYEIAQSQVGALESGVVKQAESTLRVAEAAYRHGERGILDYLDAQRVFRQARNDLIAARADLRAAAVELDRLRAEAP
ncbi:TolC family protein [Ralstonia pseudosolanacearum]|uniref:TolC family protein n=1 Tax=Ralstonia pseudosolanacearum TaxID=1310165 RepID=UPI0005C48C74|nr:MULTISPECIES: TolC family protein [Ralstonia]QKL54038.1 TolC family protein [Ralstonia solanacearum]MDO3516848.1 TolC family protein [Ralstonia pseudosolanacearum]MDO3543540.1 TolC family protein [Ralstonia pseudosolanacearum]OAI63117.1 membrane protein [Ralstonia pseudosolanacearum]QKM25292.1 TolC family protein [Ralstonia solanacearum]